MAVSKRNKRTSDTPPDEAPFARLLHDGLADVDDVLDAYEHVMAGWQAAGGEFPPVEIVAERPVIDPDEPPTVSALLIQLRRERMFKEEA